MEQTAAGEFDVQLTPTGAADAFVGSMAISKVFRGDLVATSTGQMLASGTPARGSGGYVAMEHVSGTLAGRSGAFALQHSGTMDGGTATLSVTVVPGSATEELTGLTGSMTIQVEDGKHFYSFRYVLPD